jgi:hypothetical protein
MGTIGLSSRLVLAVDLTEVDNSDKLMEGGEGSGIRMMAITEQDQEIIYHSLHLPSQYPSVMRTTFNCYLLFTIKARWGSQWKQSYFSTIRPMPF